MAITYTPPASKPKLTPGTHTVTVISAKEKVSKAGNPMVEIEVQPNDFTITLRAYLVFSEKAEWRARQVRVALGFDDPIGEQITFEAEELIGKEASVEIGLDAEGKYLEVKEWHQPDVTPAPAVKAKPLPRKPVDVDLDGDDVPF